MLKDFKALRLKAGTEQVGQAAVVHASAGQCYLLDAGGCACEDSRAHKG